MEINRYLKQSGFALIVPLIILVFLIITAGGVVVWKKRLAQPTPTVTISPKPTSPQWVPTSPVPTEPEEEIKTKGKIPYDLLSLYDEYVAFQGKGAGEEFKSTNSLLRIYGDKVVVDAVASGDVSVLQADLQKLGASNLTAFGRMVSGRLPILSINDLSELDSLQFIRASAMQT